MSRGYHRQSRTRDTLSLVFAFFLSLTLLACAALVVLRVGLFSRVGLRSGLSETYYEAVLEHVESSAMYYTMPTGIDPSVTEGVFDLAGIKEDVDSYFTSVFAEAPWKPSTETYEARLSSNALQALGDYEVPADAGEAFSSKEEIIEAYVAEIMAVYRDAIEIPGMATVMNMRGLYQRYFLVALVLFAGLAVVLVVSILRLHHHVHRSLRYVAYAAGGAALMSIVAPGVMLFSGRFFGLSVSPRSFYLYVTNLISHVLRCCLFAGGVLAVMTVALVIVISRIRQKTLKTRRHSS